MTTFEEPIEDKLRRMLASSDEVALRAFLEELQPFDIADALPSLSEPERLHLLAAVAPAISAEALEHLDPDEQVDLLKQLDVANARDILTAMSDDALADLVGSIHPREASRLLEHVPEKDVAQVRQLMSYDETSAGGRMTTGYLSARRAWTAEHVIQHFRKVGRDVEVAHYVYVVDRHGNLVGVTSLRDVLLEPPDALVSDFMHSKVISVRPEDDQELAARLLGQYDFGAIPVARADGRMVGVLTVDDVFDVAEEEATEDIQKTAAVDPLGVTYSRASVWTLYRSRIGWLGVLVLLNLISAAIIAAYSDTLATALVLASFIPLLIGSGGNTGSQSATLMIRALSTHDVQMSDWAKAFTKELVVGVLLGLTLGTLAAVLGYMRGDYLIGAVVGLTMVVVVITANLAGMALPFILSFFKADPAVASSPLISTLADAAGLLSYFWIASWILGL